MLFQNYYKPILLSLVFLIGLVSIAILLFYLKNGAFPNPSTALCSWDCGWYVQLRDSGYVLKLDDESNPAFFPLFSYIWRWTGFSFIQMSIMNALLFIVSVGIMATQFKMATRSLIFFLCIGLQTFFVVPYSESLFFIGSSLFLIGFHKNEKTITILGFAIAVGARSASIIFIAASVVLLAIALVQKEKQKIELMILALSSTVLCTLGVMTIQYYQTRNFFAFFYAQQFWDHHLGIPAFPLTSWHWPTHLSDSVGLLFGLVAIIISLGFCIKLMLKLPYPKTLSILFKQEPMDLAYLFSFLYLAGTTSTILLFQGGNIHSLNRYVFSTPFFLLFVNAFITQKIQVSFTWVQYILVACILGILMPGQSYLEHYLLITASVVFIPVSLFFQYKTPTHKVFKILVYIGIIMGIIIQLLLLSKYFEGNWMG
jgi:hypothetical protein